MRRLLRRVATRTQSARVQSQHVLQHRPIQRKCIDRPCSADTHVQEEARCLNKIYKLSGRSTTFVMLCLAGIQVPAGFQQRVSPHRHAC